MEAARRGLAAERALNRPESVSASDVQDFMRARAANAPEARRARNWTSPKLLSSRDDDARKLGNVVQRSTDKDARALAADALLSQRFSEMPPETVRALEGFAEREGSDAFKRELLERVPHANVERPPMNVDDARNVLAKPENWYALDNRARGERADGKISRSDLLDAKTRTDLNPETRRAAELLSDRDTFEANDIDGSIQRRFLMADQAKDSWRYNVDGSRTDTSWEGTRGRNGAWSESHAEVNNKDTADREIKRTELSLSPDEASLSSSTTGLDLRFKGGRGERYYPQTRVAESEHTYATRDVVHNPEGVQWMHDFSSTLNRELGVGPYGNNSPQNLLNRMKDAGGELSAERTVSSSGNSVVETHRMQQRDESGRIQRELERVSLGDDKRPVWVARKYDYDSRGRQTGVREQRFFPGRHDTTTSERTSDVIRQRVNETTTSILRWETQREAANLSEMRRDLQARGAQGLPPAKTENVTRTTSGDFHGTASDLQYGLNDLDLDRVKGSEAVRAALARASEENINVTTSRRTVDGQTEKTLVADFKDGSQLVVRDAGGRAVAVMREREQVRASISDAERLRELHVKGQPPSVTEGGRAQDPSDPVVKAALDIVDGGARFLPSELRKSAAGLLQSAALVGHTRGLFSSAASNNADGVFRSATGALGAAGDVAGFVGDDLVYASSRLSSLSKVAPFLSGFSGGADLGHGLRDLFSGKTEGVLKLSSGAGGVASAFAGVSSAMGYSRAAAVLGPVGWGLSAAAVLGGLAYDGVKHVDNTKVAPFQIDF